MGLALSARDVAALEARTEGWIAGLQLAALSMQGRDDSRVYPGIRRRSTLYRGLSRRGGVGASAGTGLRRPCSRPQSSMAGPALSRRRHRAGAMAARAWTPCSEATFSSCRWMTGDTGIAITISLATFCGAHAPEEQPDQIAYHSPAGQRLVRADTVSRPRPSTTPWPPRIRHARRTWSNVHRRPCARSAGSHVAELVRALPDEVLRCRPLLGDPLCRGLATVRTTRWGGGLPAGRRALAGCKTIGVNPLRPRTAPIFASMKMGPGRCPGLIAIYRAGMALALGDVAARTHARRVLDLVGEGRSLGRGAAAGLLGLAAWTSGDLEAAHRSYADGMANFAEGRVHPDAVGGVHRVGRRHGSAGPAPRGDGAPTSGAAGRRRRPRRPLRGTADMHVACAKSTGSVTKRRGRAAPAAKPGARVISTGTRRTRIAGVLLRRGSAKPKEILTARSICSTRRSAATRATSSETCVIAAIEGEALDRPGEEVSPRLGAGARTIRCG